MSHPKQKHIRLLRQRVREKRENVRQQREALFSVLNTATDGAMTAADNLLATEDGSVFSQHYMEVMQVLEHHYNALTLVTASAEEYLDSTDEDSQSSSLLELHNQRLADVSQTSTALSTDETSAVQEITLQTRTASPVQVHETPRADVRSASPSVCAQNESNIRSPSPSVCAQSVPNLAQPEQTHDEPKLALTPAALSAFNVTEVTLEDLKFFQPAVDDLPCTEPARALVIQEGQYLKVMVSFVRSPHCLWVQPYGNELNLLMEEICQHFSKAGLRRSKVENPEKGGLCVAQFSSDNALYRARIMNVLSTPTDGSRNQVEVYYLDYGNSECISASRIWHLPSQFTTLPAQAICCALAKVAPPLGALTWSPQIGLQLSQLVAGTVLTCVVGPFQNSVPIVDLYVSQKSLGDMASSSKISLSDIMVSRGLAIYMSEGLQARFLSQQLLDSSQVEALQSETPVLEADPKAAGDGPCNISPIQRMVPRTPNCARKNNKSTASLVSPEKKTSPETPVIEKGSSKMLNEQKSGLESRVKHSTTENVLTAPGISDYELSRRIPSKRKLCERERISQSSMEIISKEQSQEPLTGSHASERKLSIQSSKGSSSAEHSQGHLRSQEHKSSQDRVENSKTAGSSSKQNVACDQSVEELKSAAVEKNTSSKGALKRMTFPKGQSLSADSILQHSKFYLQTQLRCQHDLKNRNATKCPAQISAPKIGNSQEQIDSSSDRRSDVDQREKSSFSDTQRGKAGWCCEEDHTEMRMCAQAEEQLKQIVETVHKERADSKQRLHDSDNEMSQLRSSSRQDISKSSDVSTIAEVRPEILVSEDKTGHLGEQEIKKVERNGENAEAQTDIMDHQEAAKSCEDLINVSGFKGKASVAGEFRDLISTLMGIVRRDPVEVMLSHVESPSSFYVHIVSNGFTAQTLTSLERDLKNHFSSLDKKTLKALSSKVEVKVGSLCCGVYSKDDGCYRVLIEELDETTSTCRDKTGEPCSSSKTEEAALHQQKVKVMYVDFGNSEWLPTSRLYPLPEQFLSQQPQAVLCQLACISAANTELINGQLMDKTTVTWGIVTTRKFESLTGYDKRLHMYIFPESTNSIMSDESGDDSPVPVVLVDPNGDEDVCINAALVDEGLAWFLKPPDGWLDKDFSKKLDEWNPAADDFLSERNSYEVDVDDAGVATVGVKLEDEKKVCRYFRTPGGCFPGERCPYLHIRHGQDAFSHDKSEAYSEFDARLGIGLPDEGSWIGVEVTAVYNPRHFYLVMPWGNRSLTDSSFEGAMPDEGYEGSVGSGETLDELVEIMTEHYQSIVFRDTTMVVPAEGEVVVAQYTQDHMWYRARVLRPEEDNMFKVFYLDFGNTEIVHESKLRKIEPQFLHLPFQAVECFLSGIMCASGAETWSKESKKYFTELVDSKTLAAFVSARSTVAQYLEIDLYDTSEEEDLNIAEDLIDAGYAVEAAVSSIPRQPQPQPSKTSQPQGSSLSNVIFVPG